MEIDHFVADVCEPHAIVREEDVQLGLTAAPGSVVVRGGRPVQLLAVVHDIDREPSWREDSIVDASRAVFREVH